VLVEAELFGMLFSTLFNLLLLLVK
jgi:hypothetical protein